MGTRINKVPAERRAEIASAGGAGRAAALAPDERAAIARAGAAKTNGAPNLAMRIRRQWSDLNKADRDAVREALAGCRGLFPKPPKDVGVIKRRPRAAEPTDPAAGA